MGALNPADPQLVNGTSQSQEIQLVQVKPDFGWVLLAQKSYNPFIMDLGSIYFIQKLAVTFPQRFQAHLRDDIGNHPRYHPKIHSPGGLLVACAHTSAFPKGPAVTLP
jgi:hypothetical protein